MREASPVALLRNLPFLSPLDDARLEKLAASASERRFARGETLCREGTACTGFWVVKEGSIRSVKTSAAGKCRVLEVAGCGGTCPMLSTLDESRCPMRTEARVDSTVFFVPCAALLAATEQVPAAATALARAYAQRARRATCDAASVCLKDVRARVAAFLIEASAEYGSGDAAVNFRMPGSQEEIAHRIGTEREVLARALRSLRDEGLVLQARDRVSIPDLSRLRALAESA